MVSKNIVIDFTEPRGGTFQKYNLLYSSKLPIKGKIFYNIPGDVYCEKFFLEAGEHKKFSSYIDNSLNGACASDIYRLEFLPVGEGDAAFSLQKIDTEKPEPSGNIISLENERFRISADLHRGGGLCEIEDKQNSDGLKNLLNCYSTRRLIQQSYYGTVYPPYSCETYENSRWPYNPVQGGDRYGNKSKIVDYNVSEDCLYVKCQPMDWAQDNRISPSYMENIYQLAEDYIRVSNRFIDFSGYEHRMSQQELPSFSVISYLDYFTFYNGSAPWTEDALTGKGRLDFWENQGYFGNRYFNVQEGHTETWCAWTAGELGFGIGLYTPGVEFLFAEHCGFNASKDPADDACNYAAPICTLCLESYKPLEYGYLITTGDLPSIRETFTKYKDFQVNVSFREFIQKNNL